MGVGVLWWGVVVFGGYRDEGVAPTETETETWGRTKKNPQPVRVGGLEAGQVFSSN